MPFFGTVALNALEEYYESETEMDGKIVLLDLDFDQDSISIENIDPVRLLLENLGALDRQNISSLIADYQDVEGDTVKGYLRYHLETMAAEELSQITGNQDVNLEIALLKQLHLVRICFFPDSDTDFAIFDYSISLELTDQLIALYLDKQGQLEFMTVERLM